jgi:hypothetical protein
MRRAIPFGDAVAFDASVGLSLLATPRAPHCDLAGFFRPTVAEKAMSLTAHSSLECCAEFSSARAASTMPVRYG